MTNEAFDRGMAQMAATWPDRERTPATFAVYRDALDDMSDSVFEAAVKVCVKGCKFFPVPAEIREKAMEILGAAGLLPKTGEQAWERLVSLLPKYSVDNGWYNCTAKSPLDDMTEQAVRAMGGMRRICNCDLHDLGFLRREFLEYYEPKRHQELEYGQNLLAQPLRRVALPEAAA